MCKAYLSIPSTPAIPAPWPQLQRARETSNNSPLATQTSARQTYQRVSPRTTTPVAASAMSLKENAGKASSHLWPYRCYPANHVVSLDQPHTTRFFPFLAFSPFRAFLLTFCRLSSLLHSAFEAVVVLLLGAPASYHVASLLVAPDVTDAPRLAADAAAPPTVPSSRSLYHSVQTLKYTTSDPLTYRSPLVELLLPIPHLIRQCPPCPTVTPLPCPLPVRLRDAAPRSVLRPSQTSSVALPRTQQLRTLRTHPLPIPAP